MEGSPRDQTISWSVWFASLSPESFMAAHLTPQGLLGVLRVTAAQDDLPTDTGLTEPGWLQVWGAKSLMTVKLN